VTVVLETPAKEQISEALLAQAFCFLHTVQAWLSLSCGPDKWVSDIRHLSANLQVGLRTAKLAGVVQVGSAPSWVAQLPHLGDVPVAKGVLLVQCKQFGVMANPVFDAETENPL